MNRNKCNRCGLINAASDENCRRCRTNLYSPENAPPQYAPAPPVADAAPAKKTSPIITFFVIALLVPAVFYYFKTRDDDKIRMNTIIENDRQRQQEMSAERQKQSDKENLDKYNERFTK